MNIKDEIIDAIDLIVQSAIKKVCPAIVFGVVVAVNTKNKCQVKINDVTHNITYYGDIPIINQKYPIFIPFNNMSLAFTIINTPKEEYQLPIATSEILGGIRIGDTLVIDANGVLNVKPEEEEEIGDEYDISLLSIQSTEDKE